LVICGLFLFKYNFTNTEFLIKLLIILVINEIEYNFIFRNFLQIVLCVKLNILAVARIKKIKGPHWPNIGFPENVDTTWLTIPKPGIIKI